LASGPLVTVAVPTFNRAGYLRECIESIRAQTYTNLEILVGDNASTDSTADVIRELAAAEPRLRAVSHQQNLGMVGNFNALLRAARGAYFLLLSDDDLLPARGIELLLDACRRPGVAFAYGMAAIIDGEGRVRGLANAQGPALERGRDFIRAHLRGQRSVNLAATMFPIGEPERREYYNAEIGSVCDLLHRLTLAASGDVAAVPGIVAFYRVHAASLTSSAADFAASHCRLLTTPSVTSGILSEYRGEVRAYVASYLALLARGFALRGNAGAARETAAVMKANGLATGMLLAQLRVLSWRPVRLAADARRAVLGWRARRNVAV
jgi:glycosyltransferase involved in cell wall biosynthesis